MKSRYIVAAMALTLAAQPLLADGARGRQPRSGGGKHSSSGDRRGPSSSGFRAPVKGAEQRHPRVGTGRGYHRSYGYSRYSRSYNRYPAYWGLGYLGYGYGYGYGWPYSYSPYYYGYWGAPYYYRDSHAGSGAVRVQVEPEQTRVLVDGYYAGVADDFDGVFQRLYVSPGRHEIQLRLDGYRTHRVRVYVAADATMKLRFHMEKGAGEESFEDLGGDRPEADSSDRYEARPISRPDREGPGRLRLEVRPDDASVYVDGQFWGNARVRAELELPPGRHRVEVVRPGYRTEEREVVIQAGRTERLELELVRP